MKVCLRRGYHPVFDELIRNPPAGVEYVVPKLVAGSSTRTTALKRRLWVTYLNLRREPYSLYVPCSGELIHSGVGALVRNKRPWVVDIDHVNNLVGFRGNDALMRVKRKAERYLASPYCKKIMPWTQAGMNSIKSALDCAAFEDKIEVVYPAIKAPEKVKRSPSQKARLLFASDNFYNKGGPEVLRAYAELKKKYDVELVMLTNAPEDFKEKHADVNFVRHDVPYKVLMGRYFASADVFVMPTYMDTFGLAYLNAMACGVPVVTTNVFAMPEIVQRCGFLIDASRYSCYDENGLFKYGSHTKWLEIMKDRQKPDIVEGLVEAVAKLLEDSRLRKRLGNAGRKAVATGRFSLRRRNTQLKRIYEEAARR